MAGCGSKHAAGGGEGDPIRRWPPSVPAPAVSPWRRPLSWLALKAIRGYQKSLSRLWPDICIYWPSCSHYTAHAIVNRGLARGILLGAWRILHCHPFAEGGYDPPPGYEEILARDKAGMDKNNVSRDAGA